MDTNPSDAQITEALHSQLQSELWISPEENTAVIMIREPGAAPPPQSFPHRSYGRLVALDHNPNHLPHNEILHTREAFGHQRIRQVQQRGGFAFPVWHDPDITGTFRLTYTPNIVPPDLHRPALIAAYLIHPDERIPNEQAEQSLCDISGPRYVPSTKIMRAFYEELETELKKARNWDFSGTYLLYIFKKIPCQDCGEPVWSEKQRRGDLYGRSEANELVDFLMFPAGLQTTGDNAWKQIPFPDLEQWLGT